MRTYLLALLLFWEYFTVSSSSWWLISLLTPYLWLHWQARVHGVSRTATILFTEHSAMTFIYILVTSCETELSRSSYGTIHGFSGCTFIQASMYLVDDIFPLCMFILACILYYFIQNSRESMYLSICLSVYCLYMYSTHNAI